MEEDSIQQQHNGVVVVEERGNPAGLRQAPWEKRRRERGRAAPTRDQIACYGQPLGLIYIGEGEGCAPFRVSHPKGRRPASRWHLVRRPREGGGVHPPQGTSEVPSPFRTLPSSCPFGAWASRGWCPWPM